MKGLTDRQKEFLQVIEKLILKHGYSPSFREIGGELGITVKGVYDHIYWINKKGCYLKWKEGMARTIRLTEKYHTEFCNGG